MCHGDSSRMIDSAESVLSSAEFSLDDSSLLSLPTTPSPPCTCIRSSADDPDTRSSGVAGDECETRSDRSRADPHEADGHKTRGYGAEERRGEGARHLDRRGARKSRGETDGGADEHANSCSDEQL